MERHQVNILALATTANEMVANGKGLLAIDESNWNLQQTLRPMGDSPDQWRHSLR